MYAVQSLTRALSFVCLAKTECVLGPMQALPHAMGMAASCEGLPLQHGLQATAPRKALELVWALTSCTGWSTVLGMRYQPSRTWLTEHARACIM